MTATWWWGIFIVLIIPSAPSLLASASTLLTAPALLTTAALLPLSLTLSLRSMFLMTMLLFPVGFFQRLQADLAYQVHKTALRLLGFARADLYRLQAVRHHILQVELTYLSNPFDSKGILLIAVRQHIPHEVFKDVFLDKDRRSLLHLQRLRIIREVLQGIQVGIQLIVQTAFEPAALTAELTLVDG